MTDISNDTIFPGARYTLLDHSIQLPSKTNFAFMDDDGGTGFKNVISLGGSEYFFILNNDFVKSVDNPELGVTTFYSNRPLTNTGINPNGITILGIGDPRVFAQIQKS